MKFENPVTFIKPSYILFNVTKHCCATFPNGHLGIFSTKNVADIAARATEKAIGDKIIVLAVDIKPIDPIPL